MDLVSHAGLLAQVIPAVLIAMVVEFRAVHDTWRSVAQEQAKNRPQAERQELARLIPRQIAVQLGVMLVLTLLEVAALVVAGGRSGPLKLAEWIVRERVAVFVLAAGLALILQWGALALMQSYQRAGLILDEDRRSFHWVLRMLLYATIFGAAWLTFG
ncbi:hypothetical protein MTP10_26595 [Nonomuraea sp. 3-1Str]|uniref:hypothetical protein n=1 Tax=unclassified Nonomuraea TaxID=2593643 RepID=UPI00285C6EA9|nr:hypothetical protein [Nonomuraea sp. 3-1Str]MDR8412292.1 hypothetical protein [Nonomuraea sp. 3-1Str]